MQRTRRDSDFDDRVRRAMSRPADHRAISRFTGAAIDAPRHEVSEVMARWETEGGALVRTAAPRPRPLP